MDTLVSSAEAIIKAMEARIKAAEPKIRKAAAKEIQTLAPAIFDAVEYGVRENFDTAIDQFYNEYTPKHYKNRAYSMREILQIERTSNSITWRFDPNDVTYGGEGTHTKRAFLEGWHGGAPGGPNHPDPGTPYYRKPLYLWTEWSRPAVQSSIPPVMNFRELMDSWKNNAASLMIKSIISDAVNKAVKTELAKIGLKK